MATGSSSSSTPTRRSGMTIPPPSRTSSPSSSREPSPLRELLDLLLRQGLQAGQEGLYLPLARVVGEDQLLRVRAVGDVGHPVVEIRRSAPDDGDATHAHAATAFHFGERFASRVHWPAKLTSAVIALSRVRLSAKNGGAVPRRGARAAWNPEKIACPPSVDEGSVTICKHPRGRASGRLILASVDRCGHVDKLCAFFWPPASRRHVEEALEDLAGEDRAAR